MKIVLPGGSGQVGTVLARAFHADGHEVVVLSRLEIGAWLMRIETELVLKSRRVVPGRLLAGGFPFAFPDWDTAAADLVARRRRRR